jgi:hypothetical protein
MIPAVTLTTPENVEGLRRSVAMLPPQAPALNREDAIEVLAALQAALRRVPR